MKPTTARVLATLSDGRWHSAVSLIEDCHQTSADRRMRELRAMLDALKAEYLNVARDQDNHPGRLRAINAEREPLFAELAALGAGSYVLLVRAKQPDRRERLEAPLPLYPS